MTEREIKISGMSCQHCVMAVKRELAKIAGLEVEEVKIGAARVAYDEAKVDQRRIQEAVVEAGYAIVE